MESTEAVISSETSSVPDGASSGTNHNYSNPTTTAAAAVVATSTTSNTTSGTVYGKILDDLCRRIEGTSYYSGSSATWLLRGALAKYEEDSSLFPGKSAFLPRRFTDVLVERILLREEGNNSFAQQSGGDGDQKSHEGNCNGPDNDSDPDHKKFLTVAKALACDHTKYLPAIAASLSNLLSSIPSIVSPTTIADKKKTRISIPREFLQIWVSAIIDPSTPQNLHDQLSDGLFVCFDRQLKLNNVEDRLALPEHALCYTVEGDSWNRNCKTKALSPPDTEASLRRASLIVRFLSRGLDCTTLDGSTKLNIADSSGAIEWFLNVLGGKECPTRHQNQHRETRSGLLGLFVDECKAAAGVEAVSVEWLFSPKLETAVLLFFKDAIRELVEDWNEHLTMPPKAKSINQPRSTNLSSSSQNRTNRDLLSKDNRGALFCATLYVRYLARVPTVCPRLSFAVATEASGDDDHDGRDLLARMLRDDGFSLQRLRLVRLLIDEFGSREACETDAHTGNPAGNASRKEWLSSPDIMAPVLEVCSNDPFLGSSDAAIRYLGIYGDPSWKESFLKKPMPREAPVPIAFRSSPATDFARTSSAPTLALKDRVRSPSWLSESVGMLRRISAPREGTERGSFLQVVRNTVEDRFGSKSQDEHFGLYDAGHQTSSATSRQHDHYNLFPGGR